MKKALLLFFLVCTASILNAQQSVQYTQFMLNEYAFNPAVAGSKKGANFLIGRRYQWLNFDNAPETTFIGGCKDFRKKGAHQKISHGIGAYYERDKFGVFLSDAITASYAIHIKPSYTYTISIGLAGGIKNVVLNNLIYSKSDPAVNRLYPKVVIPVVIPGIYFYTTKTTIGIGVKDIYKNKLIGKKDTIGTDGKLEPSAYITVSKKYRSADYDYVFIPAIQVITSFKSIPAINLNCMAIYHSRLGLGVSYRSMDAVSVLLQMRITKNIIVGLAYDCSVSRMIKANPHSLEGMLGFTPLEGAEAEFEIKGMPSKCPAFDF